MSHPEQKSPVIEYGMSSVSHQGSASLSRHAKLQGIWLDIPDRNETELKSLFRSVKSIHSHIPIILNDYKVGEGKGQIAAIASKPGKGFHFLEAFCFNLRELELERGYWEHELLKCGALLEGGDSVQQSEECSQRSCTGSLYTEETECRE